MIYDLQANYQINPIGIELDQLTLSWKQDTAYDNAKITIATDDKFENVVFEQNVKKKDGIAFTPKYDFVGGTKYYWRIADSEAACFEGGYPEEQWQAKWISPCFVPEFSPVFKKTFLWDGNIKSARLYICGLGLYEVYINGKKVGDQYLTPYFTDYRFWIEYQTYDVAEYIQKGENTITVFLGAGWYKGGLGFIDGGRHINHYGSKYKLLAEMIITDTDVTRICTDETWSCEKSPLVSSGIYDGEVWDERRNTGFLSQSENDLHAVCTKAPKGKLTAMIGTKVSKHEAFDVKEVIYTQKGETVLDFGQEITGWMVSDICIPRDSKIKFMYSEILQDGNFYRDNLRAAKAEYEYYSDGQTKLIRPHFTYYGFRYVKVEGIKIDESNVNRFKAWALYSDLRETGNIKTDHEDINRLILNTKWSQKDNFLDVPTDCPQRDERLGWTGDAQIFSSAASYHMQTPAFYRKYLKDMRYEQMITDGAVPFVVPDVLSIERIQNGEPPFDMSQDKWGEAGSCAWGDAATIIPWNMYVHYGNKKWLKESYKNMKLWVSFIEKMDNKYCGGKKLWQCGFHFGDWLSLDAENGNLQGGTDKYFIASIYYMYSSLLTAKAAKVLGKEDDEKYYSQLAEDVRSAIRNEYLLQDCRLKSHTQTAYAVGIIYNLFNEEEIQIAGNYLVSLLEKNNYKLATGFVGTAFLCEALVKVNRADLAYRLLLNEEYPGWLYEVKLGATTIWERWNSVLPDGHISDTGMNSLNHYAYGCIVEWIYKWVCGFEYDENKTAGRLMHIHPLIDSPFENVNGHIDTMVGRYSISIAKKDSETEINLEVPYGGKAILTVCEETKELTAGSYSFLTRK